MNTQEQKLENLQKLHDYVRDRVKDDQFNMKNFRSKKGYDGLIPVGYYSLNDCGTHGCLAGYGPHAGILPTNECFLSDGRLDWDKYIDLFFELTYQSDCDSEEGTFSSVFDTNSDYAIPEIEKKQYDLLSRTGALKRMQDYIDIKKNQFENFKSK